MFVNKHLFTIKEQNMISPHYFIPCRYWFTITVLKEPKYHMRTFLNGLTLDVILYSYLQSSQHSLSELLIHFCRHSWCTNFMLPSQRQGAMRGESSSISHTSHWQIRQQSWPEDSMDRLVSHRSDSLGVGEFTWRVSYKAHTQINYNIYKWIVREVNQESFLTNHTHIFFWGGEGGGGSSQRGFPKNHAQISNTGLGRGISPLLYRVSCKSFLHILQPLMQVSKHYIYTANSRNDQHMITGHCFQGSSYKMPYFHNYHLNVPSNYR